MFPVKKKNNFVELDSTGRENIMCGSARVWGNLAPMMICLVIYALYCITASTSKNIESGQIHFGQKLLGLLPIQPLRVDLQPPPPPPGLVLIKIINAKILVKCGIQPFLS